MSRIEEIEAAISELPVEEFRKVAEWLIERDRLLWEQQIDSDSASGRLDFLFDEAESELKGGFTREWPSTL